MKAETVNSQVEVRAVTIDLLADEEEERLVAREIAAKRHAATKAAGCDTWTTRKKLGEKSPPDIFAVHVKGAEYKYIGRTGKRHLLFGSTGSGKTFAAAGFAAQWMISNRPVAWIDFEDQADDLPSMLAAWGVHSDELLHYFAPAAPPDIAEFTTYCQAEQITLVIIDAAIGAYANTAPGKDYGYSGMSEETFDRDVLRHLAKAGITTVLIDHSGHDPKGRPIGAARKLQVTDIAFEVTSVSEISEQGDGCSSLTVRKFRGGAYAKGSVAAYFTVSGGKAALKAESGHQPTLGDFASQYKPSAAELLQARCARVVAYVSDHQDQMPNQASIKEALMSGEPGLFTSEFITRGAIKHASETGRIAEKEGGTHGHHQKVYELPG